MAIRDELLKELLAEYKKPEDLLGPNGLLKRIASPWPVVNRET